MDNSAEQAIKDYIDMLYEPSRNWPQYYFEERCYMRWAAKEILLYIRSNPQKTPIEATAEFMGKARKSAQSDRRTRSDRFIFETACEAAEDILDILRAME